MNLDELLEKYGHRVWNKWNAPEYSVYIGRGSLYGNPIPLLDPKNETERIECILEFTEYLGRRIQAEPAFAGAVMSLRNQNLKCYCSNGKTSKDDGARYCHGLVLLYAADLLHTSSIKDVCKALHAITDDQKEM